MAAEFGASAAANALGNLATEYTTHYIHYFFRFGRIVGDFRIQLKELESKKDRVINDVNEALRQNEVIEKDVEHWLTRAAKELGEAQTLADQIERKKCFNWCPNWGWRYCLSKKVAKRTLIINKLLETSNFQRVGYRSPLQGLELMIRSKHFKPSESSNSAFNEIIQALNTVFVNMIGLYGMPGVGKTTLAKEVGKHAKEQRLFDKVVMVTMSQTPNIKNIQDKIAEIIGLQFRANTEEGRAEELWEGLKKVKKILIVVDDVWKEIKLETIGIPFGGEHEGCKIVLTTRLHQVCTQMNCQEKIQLNIFSEDEAWALFKDNAGLHDASSPLKAVAKEVCRECQGLPLAIVTMGKALKGESLDGWKAAKQRLKDSRHLDNWDVCEGIYSCLKLSYDYLKEENIQSCFLLCSLFPEDSDIRIEMLTICGIGQGLFCSVNKIEELRREICLALVKLQRSGLLMEARDEETVRMHDVVRDFAHWLTSTGENRFMVKDGLTEWPMSESFGCYKAISLWNSNIINVPERLEFPKLKTLFLTGKQYSSGVLIPSTFLEGIEDLRVLLLKAVVFPLEALQYLTNIRTLCFIDCKLGNISLLRNVKNLEILALLDTNIVELPEELLELGRLKSLYFSNWLKSNFPPYFLSRLTSLQELHVTSPNNANILELNSLPLLTALSFNVSIDQCLQPNFMFPRLPRYYISVNYPKKTRYGVVLNQDQEYMKGLSLRTLIIHDFSSSLNAFKELFCNVEKLTLMKVKNQKNIVPNIDQRGLNELISLELKWCSLECLIDTTKEQLCFGQPLSGFFQNLKEVNIEACELLKVLFRTDTAYEIEESWMPPLLSNLTSLSLYSLPALETIWPTHRACLQSLKIVQVKNCDNLKSIFPPFSQSLLYLQRLEISYCYGLEQVFVFQEEMPEQLGNQALVLSNLASIEMISLPELKCIWKGPTHFVNLRSLKTMDIYGCHKLEYLCSTPLAQTLVHLETLHVRYCDSLEFLIKEVKNEAEVVSKMLWPNLRILKINDCESLKEVFPLTLAQGLPCLESVEVNDCPQLNQLFSPLLAQSLVQLQELKVHRCDGLQHITGNDGIIESDSGLLRLPFLLKLTTLQISNCRKLECVFQIPSGQEDNGIDCAIFLPHLQDLRLGYLINFSCFCSGSYCIASPSLLMLIVDNCPQLTNFTIQKEVNAQVQLKQLCLYNLGCDIRIDTTNLQMRRSSGHLEYITVGNCEKIFHTQAGHFFSRAESISMHSLHQLRGPIQVASLQHLTTLNMSYCHRLKSLFSPMLAQNLPQLSSLELWHCEELEQIIGMDESSASPSQSHLQPILFPCLGFISIIGCKNLKSLFPISVTYSLAKLWNISICKASKLEHVFECQGEADLPCDHKDVVLPKLKILRLEELPSLKNFTPMCHHFQFPLWYSIEVRGCPKLTTTFRKHSNYTVHAVTEASPQVQIGIEESFNAREQIDANQPTYCDIVWQRNEEI